MFIYFIADVTEISNDTYYVDYAILIDRYITVQCIPPWAITPDNNSHLAHSLLSLCDV